MASCVGTVSVNITWTSLTLTSATFPAPLVSHLSLSLLIPATCLSLVFLQSTTTTHLHGNQRIMEELSAGPFVPAVKSDLSKPIAASSTAISGGTSPPTEVAVMSEPDKDLLCPICMQIIKDAFLTACGHSFCYMCITTHLRNKNDCPCCGHYLTNNHLFPNFLLDKVRLSF